MICSCCGCEIKEKVHGPYNDGKCVCDRCWKDPCLFFPDKVEEMLDRLFTEGLESCIKDLNLLEVIDFCRMKAINAKQKLAKDSERINEAPTIKINVIKVSQKGMPLYLGKLKAAELLILSSVDQWHEKQLEGFQRERFKSKNREIKEFIKKCPLPMVPSLLASFQYGAITSVNNDFGVLEIPIVPGSISLLDGQQRAGGFEEAFYEFKELIQKGKFNVNDEIYNLFSELMRFEIPIVFLDSKRIIEKMSEDNKKMNQLKPIDVDRACFFIINKTQKPVNPSLKDELAYLTLSAGISGIPVIDKEKWRTEIVPIANYLSNQDSPLCGLISLGGLSGLCRPIQLNSFVTSLKPLFVDNELFAKYYPEKKREFLENYWMVIRETFPKAFEEETRKDYLLTKTIGIFPLNYLANDIFNLCLQNNLDPVQPESIRPYINKLENIDWTTKTSPFTYFAGKKGAKKAYEVLAETITANADELA